MLILLTASVAVLLIAMYGFMPWASRLLTLYVLHGLRDRLYQIGQSERVRSQLLYRDVEFLLCFALNRVRGGHVVDIRRILRALFTKRSTPSITYRRSAEALGEHLDGIMALLAPCVVVLGLYILMQRPAHLAAASVIVPVFLLLTLINGFFDGPLMRVAHAVNEATQEDAQRNVTVLPV